MGRSGVWGFLGIDLFWGGGGGLGGSLSGGLGLGADRVSPRRIASEVWVSWSGIRAALLSRALLAAPSLHARTQGFRVQRLGFQGLGLGSGLVSPCLYARPSTLVALPVTQNPNTEPGIRVLETYTRSGHNPETKQELNGLEDEEHNPKPKASV
jgi:hypothetical protein